MRKEPFYHDRPVFVKRPFNACGRHWERGQEFPWLTLSIDETKVRIMYYNADQLIHDSDREKDIKVGDGLDELNSDGLAELVKAINEKVKTKTSSKAEYDRKKCKQSKIDDKQRGLIRRWRSNFGAME